MDNGLDESAEIVEVRGDGADAIICKNGKCGTKSGTCFVAGTPVQIPEGQKAIEFVKDDDKVISYDVDKKETVISRVIRTFSKEVNKLRRIFTSNDTLLSTLNHPFYLPKEGKYVMASNIKAGMKVLALSGAMMSVDSVATIDSTATVYNFEVEGVHNYYVGDEGVLVHNHCNVDKLAKKWGVDDIDNRLQSLDPNSDLTSLRENLGKDLFESDFWDYLNDADLTLGQKMERVRAWEAMYRANLPEAVRKNVENLAYVENHVANTTKTFDNVVDELPKLGSFENWVEWNSRWHLTDIILDFHVEAILDEIPDAFIGYRGSLVTGQKYNGGNPIPFDPTSFDVDGFIVSDQFAAQFTGPGWRNARNESEVISAICDDLQDGFIASLPGYKYGPGEHPFTFRVWTMDEYLSIVEPAGSKIINQ